MATFTQRLKDIPNPSVGLDIYPIFDIDYREGLNKKIVEHYWNREIGMESVDMFQFAMRRKMNEIMPYYNQLYETERIKFDPLSTMNIANVSERDSETKNDTTGTSNTTGGSGSRAITVESDFPQTALDDNDTGNYANHSTESNTDGTSTGTANENRSDAGTGNEKGSSTTTGYTGPASELLTRFRGTLLNIDMMVIADLQELFMSVWDNGDTYTESGFIA